MIGEQLSLGKLLLEDEAGQNWEWNQTCQHHPGLLQGLWFDEFLCSGQEGLGEVVLS